MPDHPIKTKIIALAKLLREYEPVLVNEKWNGKYKHILGDDLDLDRDRLVQTAGEAMKELVQFIKDHEKLKTDYRELYVDALETHQFLKSVGINSPSLAQAVEVLTGRIRQCYDVLHHIAHNLPADRTKEVAARFLAPLMSNAAIVTANNATTLAAAQAAQLEAIDQAILERPEGNTQRPDEGLPPAPDAGKHPPGPADGGQ